MPKMQFKVDVEKIDVSTLLRKIVEKAIKELFLHPKKYYIENFPGNVSDSCLSLSLLSNGTARLEGYPLPETKKK
jgi:hypothetical protein